MAGIVVATWLTWVRIGLMVPLVWLILQNEFMCMVWSFIVFAIMWVLWELDRKLASKRNKMPDTEAVFSPIADEIMMDIIFVCLALMKAASIIIPIIFIVRDFIMDGVRMLAANKRIMVPVTGYERAKATLQTLAIIFTMFNIILISGAWNWCVGHMTTMVIMHYCELFTKIGAVACSVAAVADYGLWIRKASTEND